MCESGIKIALAESADWWQRRDFWHEMDHTFLIFMLEEAASRGEVCLRFEFYFLRGVILRSNKVT
jgi:hypothetical protein